MTGLNGHRKVRPQHDEPVLLVAVDHDGTVLVGGCDACADVPTAAVMLERIAATMRANPAGRQP